MNKSFPKIWLIIIICVVVIGGIFAWQYFVPQKDATKTPQAAQDGTADWKTYSNEEIGFAIKYPSSGDWEVKEERPGFSLSLLSKEYRDFLKQCEERERHEEPGPYCQYGIGIWETPASLFAGGDYVPLTSFTSFTIGDYVPLASLGAKIITHATYTPTLNVGIPSKKKSDTFIIFYLLARDDHIAGDKETFEQILSTFRFVDFVDKDRKIEGWQPYYNDKFGFEVKYPSGWQLDLRDDPSLVRFDVEKDNFLTKEEFKARTSEYTYYDLRFSDDIRIKIYVSLNELPDNENNLDLEEWIEKGMEHYLIVKNSKKEIRVNQYKGVEVEETGIVSYRSIFLPRNSLVYNFFLEASHPEMDNFNKMLSTFRFVK